MKIDYKKTMKELYLPPVYPTLIDVPAMKFLQIQGCGNPNEPNGEYQQAVGLLYAYAFTIKMMLKQQPQQDDIFDYVVPPLEGLWWMQDEHDFNFQHKDQYCWISMIRQPDFVTIRHFETAKKQLLLKDSAKAVDKVRLAEFKEGLSLQCLHIGKYDDEPATVLKINEYARQNGLLFDFSAERHHHEIYLSNPQRTAAERLKTIIRHPVKRD
ncbi:hypothetical protein SDC9_118391 [bioreactor metagenome]|uniref:GyrI-like small molecule binding domain-containing protein n=1 Tax=bioreactor metagenome TaxID=1076179 RepID=A0A645C0T6_9ZZZZ|nr:GyrI-like domain-containing protein [Erysipelotrichaceae bacterium]